MIRIQMIPKPGEHVFFTDEIVDALKKSGGKSVFIKWENIELVVECVENISDPDRLRVIFINKSFFDDMNANKLVRDYVNIMEDGTISGPSESYMKNIQVFRLAELNGTVSSQSDPKNNDGREQCFWCGAKTKQINTGFSMWNACSKCGK